VKVTRKQEHITLKGTKINGIEHRKAMGKKINEL
jgi:hypothetical protein